MTNCRAQYLNLNDSGTFFDLTKSYFQNYPNEISDTTEGGLTADFKRLGLIWAPRLYPHGDAKKAASAITNYVNNYNNNGGGSQMTIANSIDPKWAALGPIGNASTQILNNNANGNGQMHRITFHPNYNNTTNKQIFACSGFSGLWKSANNGTNWTLLNTDKLPFAGAADLAIDFTNPNNMFLATGSPDAGVLVSWSPNWGNTNPLFTAGVYRSKDAGQTWSPINGTLLTNYFAPIPGTITKIVINPTNSSQLFFTSTKGVFRTNNASVPVPTWAQVFTGIGSVDNQFRAIEFKPGTPTTIYASGRDIYKSTSSGNAGTWVSMTGPGTGLNLNTLPNGFIVTKINIAVTPADPNRIYALIVGKDNTCPNPKWSGVKVYMFKNGLWTFLYENNCGYISEGWMPIAASPTNAEEFYFYEALQVLGTDNASLLGTHPIITSSQSSAGLFHDDVHDLKFQPISSTPKMFALHDGGVSFKNTLPMYGNTTGWVMRNDGLNATLIWAFDDADNDKNRIIIGKQDAGANVYFDNPGPLKWYLVSGSDGHNARINDADKNDMYFMNYGSLRKFDPVTYNSPQINSLIPNDIATGTGQKFPFTLPIFNLPDETGDLYLGTAELVRFPKTGSPIYIQKSDIGKTIQNKDWRQITEVAISPNNTDIVYVVTGGLDDANGTADDVAPHLYKSVTGMLTGAWNPGVKTFTEITTLPISNLPGWLSSPPVITGIAVNPNNADDVWLSFTGYDPSIKVWRSLNGGLTWANQDPNNSLNNLPVNAIIYQPGTNDRVYIGTDAGVFYKDASMTIWERYGDEFPRVRVTEMKINPCSGKLRVATFGRGLWEGALLGELGESGLYKTITTNTTITNVEDVRGNIRITNSAILTVTGTINMPFNGKIIVERGCKLILDGGIITNGCDYMWQGIEVWGNKNKVQNIANCGYVILQNNAIISNARNAISTIKNTNGVWDWNYTGGVIQCTNSTFKNNARDVQFLSYKAPTIQIPYDPNKSYFNNCTFICDNKLQDPNYVDQYNNPIATPFHVTMFDVDGIDFNGCTFKTDLTNFNFNEDVRGIGIYGEEAGFYVGNLANDRGQLQNLTVGIWAKTLTGSTYINTRIKDNDFDNVRQGIVQSVGFCDMTGNVFTNMVPSTTLGLDATGILMDNAKGFIIADNNQMYGLQGNTWGVDVKGSGMYGGTICRNSFTGINWANQFEQSNEKLKTSCNTYTANYRALHISTSGLLGDQGKNCNAQTERPNNTFNTNGLSLSNLSPNTLVYYSWHNPPNPPNFDYPAGVTGPVTVNTCSGTNGQIDPSSVCGVTCGPCYGPDCAIQSKIAFLNDSNPNTKQLAFNRMINYYGYTNEDESLDSIVNLDSGNVAVKRLMVANYVSQRNGNAAQALLNTLSASNNEDAKFASFYNVLINLVNNNKRWDQVTTWQRNAITNAANSGTAIAPVALAYLEYLNKSFTFRTNAKEGFAKQTIVPTENQKDSKMSASPNPFSETTVIQVSIPNEQTWLMRVIDVTGRIILHTQLVAGKYELPIHASELNGNGIYFCQLLSNDKPIETIKIICLK